RGAADELPGLGGPVRARLRDALLGEDVAPVDDDGEERHRQQHDRDHDHERLPGFPVLSLHRPPNGTHWWAPLRPARDDYGTSRSSGISVVELMSMGPIRI